MTERFGPCLFAPAMSALVVAGTFLVDEAGYDYSDTWVTIGYTGWLISFLLGIAFYPREGKRRERLIEEHGMDDPRVDKSLRRVLAVATVDTIIVLLVVADMTTKPFL